VAAAAANPVAVSNLTMSIVSAPSDSVRPYM